ALTGSFEAHIAGARETNPELGLFWDTGLWVGAGYSAYYLLAFELDPEALIEALNGQGGAGMPLGFLPGPDKPRQPRRPRGRGTPRDSDWQIRAQSPQNPADRRLTDEELAPIRQELESMLTKKCKEFIDKLVSFNRGLPYDSGSDLLKHLNNRATSEDAGIFFGHPGVNYRQVYIGKENVSRKFYTPEQLKRSNQIYAATLLHELIHTLTRGIDDDLTENVLALGIVAYDHTGKPLPLPKNKGGGSGTDYHNYWSTALKNACFPDLR
ncbi:MAG: hypothetical protein LC795_14240, partial [Acidobacteria bacterium]|nr:hypothetical protein [Acidobacteriota bacterium]